MTTRPVKCVGNSVDTNEFFLHPISLELVLNKGPKKICPTELHYVNNKPYMVKPVANKDDDTKLSDRDIQSYMAVPYLNLNIEQMLSIYKINSIDSMVKWLDDNIGNDDKPFETINRILMAWVRLNFDELKNNNRILYSIYKKIAKKYFNKMDDNDLQNKIDNWFKKTNADKFYLDLTEHIFG